MRQLSIIIATCLLTSCAQQQVNHWTRADMNDAQLATDKAQCEFQAKASSPDTRNPISDAVRTLDLAQLCMKGKGYTYQ